MSHVDDLEGGLRQECLDQGIGFEKSGQRLEFATNHYREFIFRGREVQQTADGHIDVTMRNYALSMRSVKIEKVRRAQLQASLAESEKGVMESVAGELGWIARQLRCDLMYENGDIQRSKHDACVGDLVKLRQYVSMARRAADFRMRYWADVNLEDAVVVHLG